MYRAFSVVCIQFCGNFLDYYSIDSKFKSNCISVFTGVTSMVMLKPDELLVGSGDGNVCVVKDQTLKPSLFKKPSHDGIPKKITEPTKPCLVEVWIFLITLAKD